MDEMPEIKIRRKGKTLTQRMLIPTEAMVARQLQAAPPGRLSDLAAFRRRLAAEGGADACCPVTVQRHLVQISQNGSAPFWRVVDPDRPFARRMAGGAQQIREKMAAEGVEAAGR
jgi:alkylated DNA nucleotide flippase Atl1